jgi:hypothetical protein
LSRSLIRPGPPSNPEVRGIYPSPRRTSIIPDFPQAVKNRYPSGKRSQASEYPMVRPQESPTSEPFSRCLTGRGFYHLSPSLSNGGAGCTPASPPF